MSSLSLQQVSLRYESASVPVLDAISLEVNAGELVVALGPSGCGKTSLLKLMAGFVAPSGGEILLDGTPVRAPGAERGVVFQDDALLPWLDVLGNVAFGLKLRGVARAEREARARELLRLVDLGGYETQRIWALSGGQRQRVGLARALTADPRVLLLDEPFGALDALNREQMQALLLRVWQASRKGVFLITHDIEEAVFLASELVLLSSRPARVVERLKLDFGRRYAAGEAVRSIKSDPEFIRIREQVLSRVLGPLAVAA